MQPVKEARQTGISERDRRSVVGRWAFVLLLALSAPMALVGSYGAGLLVQSYLAAVIALVTDVIWGYAGILSFASAAMFGIGAYALGIMFVHVSPTPSGIVLALAAATLASGLVSALVGWLVFYCRTQVSEFYIAVVTLGLSVFFGQLALYGGALTGGSNGLSGFHTNRLDNQAWYVVCAVLLGGSAIVSLRIVTSDFGLVLKALRDNEVRCRYVGIRTPLTKTMVLTIGNIVVALIGVLYALFTTVVAPSLVGIVLATNVLIWVMLGGRGTVIGPAVAAVLVNAATPALDSSMPFYWQGILGLAFILVVVFLPRGLLPAAVSVLSRAAPFSGFRWMIRWLRGPHPALALEVAHEAFDRGGADDVVLDIRNVSKQYGSFHALKDVTLEVRRGELVSVVGPNGAGKTSLVRCISDGLERTSGSISLCGQGIGRHPPEVIARLGLGRKFQGGSVFGSLTVGECLKIASWKGRTPRLWAQDSAAVLPAESAAVVEALRLRDVWDIPARDISHGKRQALELAMVLALKPSVLLLDEPTAGLTVAERELVGDILRKLVDVDRLAVVLIEHDFEFVKKISSRIIVLVAGQSVADGTVAEVASSALVRAAYLGRADTEGVA